LQLTQRYDILTSVVKTASRNIRTNHKQLISVAFNGNMAFIEHVVVAITNNEIIAYVKK
jgi:hypothetical protein